MDGKVDGFDRGGASLFIDESQLVRYLDVAEQVLNQDVFAPKPKMRRTAWRRSKPWCSR